MEAMDLCEEAARLARAAGVAAVAQADSVRVPGGDVQVSESRLLSRKKLTLDEPGHACSSLETRRKSGRNPLYIKVSGHQCFWFGTVLEN